MFLTLIDSVCLVFAMHPVVQGGGILCSRRVVLEEALPDVGAGL